MNDQIRIGISACLMGQKVRYDGQHKHDRYLTDTLGRLVEYVPVCPEQECGLGIPREPMRLVGDPVAPRLVTTRTQIDHTEQMRAWATQRVQELEQEELCGFIFKGASPSSGMERVKVYNAKGIPNKTGVGLFAKAFMDHFPLLPTEEEGRLHDPVLRENFIERVFSLRRWRDTIAGGPRTGRLVAFHTTHKLLILSHSEKHYRDMGRLVADAKGEELPAAFDAYEKLLMDALRLKCTARKHVSVLQHIMGYFKKDLSTDEKQELLEIISQFKQGSLALIVPITLLNHYVRKYNKAYLAEQTYLRPHPIELQLRNHA
ncbi:MAG: DUF523 and DUF1722 domain-containing protein [Lentisphaerae bacterium]|jgi:uncharacterized protein YbgA (DUF1722 family)/uncharacterized protein YbbK (DUF523 family)|nr:DUF523 and DUF1722 domain-containing protein [Lentisphaerota bacterium]MBT4814697.1 DUF523 and DUF1722 domain-containing protein [Lentisphaerota bacterium]MBT5613113.1 DUF523 and DUF1722 domain-containing protein [Lentisphaerota bacterium]MBT7061994.1 DUF523 and DUF1722 domain-containing protein [Lentisphaerota bacterium]MBT7844444.1 DUF523 and DUF1722 domain-containing protein [Lentisphaerota bacterium]